MTLTIDEVAPRNAATPDEQMLRQMIEAATLAPSAENLQPWRFSIDDDVLTVSLDAGRGLPSDITGMLSLTGIGAAIENAVIAAREHGFEPDVDYSSSTSLLSARCLQPIAAISAGLPGKRDALHSYLSRRCTSRRMDRRPVEMGMLNRIASSVTQFRDARVDWVTSAEQVRPLASLVGLGNRIRFEREAFHREFYENVRFSRDEATATRDGLDVETLQLSLVAKKTLLWLRTWPRMRFANWFGFSRAVGRQAASEVRHSGAIGLLTIDEPTVNGMVDGGRALQRIWLATVAEGLGFHPTASLPVFLAYHSLADDNPLPTRLRCMTEELSERFGQLFPAITGRTLQMAFRVGYAVRPPVRSLRRSAQDVTYA
jgi:nitroreductase